MLFFQKIHANEKESLSIVKKLQVTVSKNNDFIEIDSKFHTCIPASNIKISIKSKIDEMNMSIPIEYIRIRMLHKHIPLIKITSSFPPF